MTATSARTANSANTVRLEGVTCPCCSLLHDDLVIEQTGNHLKVFGSACPRARAAIEKPAKKLQPRIEGKPVSLDAAIDGAADILGRSQQPLFAGLGTDVAGMRAVVALAAAAHGAMDHMHGQALSNNYRVLQSRGWMTTTLTEIRNRADLVLFIGTDASNTFGFYERAIWPQHTMFDPKPKDRQLVYLGNGLKPAKAPAAGKARKSQHLKCAPAALGEVTGALNALVNEQPVNDKVAGLKLGDLQKLVDQLRNAKYSVIVWAPGELPEDNGEQIIESICNLIESLNATTRSSGFILGGDNAATTAANVTAWLTGYPLRVSFAKGYPEYDPVAYSTANMLESGAADSLVWLSTLDADNRMPAADIPSVVIADSDKAFGNEPDVFIPAGIPGVDHTGVLIRADSVVSLPLQKLRDGNYPAAAEILRAIHAKI